MVSAIAELQVAAGGDSPGNAAVSRPTIFSGWALFFFLLGIRIIIVMGGEHRIYANQMYGYN